ncbi:MAG: hypothetical protein R2716_02260 [Microthrixaceae bacterium]
MTSRIPGDLDKFARPVAVKVLEAPGGSNGGGAALGRGPALLSAHPNILTLFDAGTTADGRTYWWRSTCRRAHWPSACAPRHPRGRRGARDRVVAGALELAPPRRGQRPGDNILVGRSVGPSWPTSGWR